MSQWYEVWSSFGGKAHPYFWDDGDDCVGYKYETAEEAMKAIGSIWLYPELTAVEPDDIQVMRCHVVRIPIECAGIGETP